MSLPVPLLAYPHLSTSAAVLAPEDREVQAALALDAFEYLCDPAAPTGWRPAEMWRGCRGALLFWVGELCHHLAQDGREWPRYVRAWGNAYRASEMTVGALPWWLSDPGFHRRSQSHLLAARPTFYGRYFIHAPLDLAYWWPIGDHEWQTTES